MMTGVMPTASPKRARRKRSVKSGEPPPPAPSPPFPPGGGKMPAPPWLMRGSLVLVGLKIDPNQDGSQTPRPRLLVRRSRSGIRLHDVIPRGTRHAVFIRSMIDDWRLSAKIVMRRGRCRRPFQCCRLPGIIRRLRSFPHTPEKIEEENKLSADGDERCIGHERLQ